MVLALSCAALAAACGRLKPAAAPGEAGEAGASGDAGLPADAGPPGDAGALGDAGVPAVALAVMNAADVTLVAPDGSRRVVYRFEGQPFDGGLSFSAGIAARDGYVAARGSWWGAAGACALDGGLLGCPEVDRVVLLDLEGRVLWEKTVARWSPSSDISIGVSVGAGGNVLLMEGTAGSTLVAPDGAEHPLPPEVAPYARSFGGPAMLVRTATSVLAWWRPDQPLELTDPPVSLNDLPDPFDTGDELDFVAASADGAPVIVHARPGQTDVLPATGLSRGGSPDARSGPWGATSDGSDVVRFNLVTGAVERFTWALPAGLRSLGWGIAADGSFVQALRDDAMAAVFVSPDAASGWTRVGLTMGQVEQIRVQDTSGTLLVDALGINQFFVPHQMWPATPDAGAPQLLQTSHQLVRPTDGVATQIFPAWYGVTLSRDGRRAAYWEATSSSTRLVIHDVASGETIPVMETLAATPPQVLWLE
jgi:hypothetical protein